MGCCYRVASRPQQAPTRPCRNFIEVAAKRRRLAATSMKLRQAGRRAGGALRQGRGGKGGSAGVELDYELLLAEHRDLAALRQPDQLRP